MNLFIVDDSDIFRVKLKGMFAMVDDVFVIGEAKDAGTAIGNIDITHPDIVILDIHMPGRSGIDVLKHIKANKPEIIVIILTNFPNPEYKQKCLSEGADYFMVKYKETYKVIELLKELALTNSKKNNMHKTNREAIQ